MKRLMSFEAVDELSVSWEVGRGLAESQQAARTDLVSCLSQLLGLLVWLFLSQEGQEPQRAARAPKLSTASGVCNSALGTSPGSWRAALMKAVAAPGKGA